MLRGKTRGAASEDALEVQAKVAQHQKMLHQQRHQDGLARWAGEEGDLNGKEGKAWKKFQSYKGEGGLPSDVDDLRVSRKSPYIWWVCLTVLFSSDPRRS